MSRCVIPGLQRHSSHRMNIAMLRFESYALLDFLFKPLTSVPYFSTGLHDAMRQISSGLGHELGQLSSRPRAWKRWVTDGCTDSCPCLSNIIRVASWTGPIATTPCSLTNVQLPEIVGLISFVSTPKTYINMVGSTVLTSGHPSTKDLSGVRIPSVPRSDRSGNGRVGAPVSYASDLLFFILTSHCLSFNSRRSLIASSNTGARHLRTNHIPSRLHIPFSFNFTDIFYSFSCSSGATTTCIPTPHQHRSLFSTDYDLIVGTQNVYKLPPFKDGRRIRLLRINLVVFPPSFSYAFVSRLVASALARVEPLSTLCPVSLSLISYQSLFLTASYLGRQPTSQPLA